MMRGDEGAFRGVRTASRRGGGWEPAMIKDPQQEGMTS